MWRKDGNYKEIVGKTQSIIIDWVFLNLIFFRIFSIIYIESKVKKEEIIFLGL